MQRHIFEKKLVCTNLTSSNFNDSFAISIFQKSSFSTNFLSHPFQKHQELENNIFPKIFFTKSFDKNNLQENK